MVETIPRKIHYCWLGGKEKPDHVKQYMKSWKEKMPDYEIIEWNETTFPFSEVECRYLRQAQEAGKWAFVTDYMRLYILYKYGGIYLDTDVEIRKSLQQFEADDSFIGFESSYTLCTAVIGAKPGQNWIRELLELYERRSFIDSAGKMDTMPNSQYIFQFLQEKKGLTYSADKKRVMKDGPVVYPQRFFSPLNYLTMKMEMTDETCTVHYYSGTWKDQREKRKDKIKGLATRVIGEKNRQRIKKLLKK